MNRLFALFSGMMALVAHAQTTEYISNAPCVEILPNFSQNDVVIRLVLPPLSDLNAQIENIKLTNSLGDFLPYYIGQNWADSSEVYVRFNNLEGEESIFFLHDLGYNHANNPLDVFDLFDSFDSSSLDETIWSSNVQNGASFNLENGELSLNVTQTDNYCTIYTNQLFDLDDNWAMLLRARTQDNRGHVCMAIGSGYDAERLNNGGYNQLNGFGLGEGHNADWIAHLRSNGNEFQTEYFGEDLTYSLLHASWTDTTYNILDSGGIASTLEVTVDEKPSGTFPFFIWLNAWDSNNRTLWLDFVAIYKSAEAITQVTMPGCMDPIACNYNALAECEGEECVYLCCPGPGCCSTGMYWDYDAEQCMNFATCENDLNGDGSIGVTDLMQLLSSFGTECVLAQGPESAQWTCGETVNYHNYDYTTVQIGEQCWFAENLRTVLYRNGDSIISDLSDIEWEELDNDGVGGISAYGDLTMMAVDYGLLYNWHAVDDNRGLCPTGWRVPSDSAFSILEVELGMSEIDAYEYYGVTRGTDQGLKMKSSPNNTPPWDGSNESGFMGLPAGNRGSGGNYSFEGYQANFWTSTAPLETMAFMRILNSSGFGHHVGRSTAGFGNGYSVRCIKD